MALLTSNEFLQSLQNQRRQGIPPSLSDICTALDNYHLPHANPEDHAGKLYIVYKRCKRWRKDYPTPPTGGFLRQEPYQSWQGKYGAVCSLLTDAVDELNGLFPGLGDSLLQYEDRKGGGVKSKKLKTLGPGYALECKTYELGGKQSAPYSGSKVLSETNDDHARFHRMKPADFTALGATIQGVATMYWCNQMQRLKKRVQYVGNEWVTIDGAQAHHPLVNATNTPANEYELRSTRWTATATCSWRRTTSSTPS